MVKLKIKELAEAKGLNANRLSRLANVDYSVVRKIFADPYTNVTTQTLSRIAKVLEVAVPDLFASA